MNIAINIYCMYIYISVYMYLYAIIKYNTRKRHGRLIASHLTIIKSQYCKKFCNFTVINSFILRSSWSFKQHEPQPLRDNDKEM
jgi:hypothetical protein